VRLHVHEWGAPDAPPVVCLHGVQAHGRRFRKLAEERLAPAGFRVLAFDLRGHGNSPWDPPWNLTAHVDDVLEAARALGLGRATWLGHSFGGRLVLELLARAPDLVERALLLDPAVETDAATSIGEAEAERVELAFADVDSALRARRETARRAPSALLEEEMRQHLVESPDGRLRYRYLQSAVVTAFGEVGTSPPIPAAPVPTLLVVADESWLVREQDVAWLRRTFGSALEVARVPGGHIVLWDAFEETAEAVTRFLER
jgi:lipase